MKTGLALLLSVLTCAAQAQVAPQIIYTISAQPVVSNGNFTSPWGGTGFTMDGTHFMYHDLPACGLNQRWTAVTATQVTTAYPLVIKVLPLPGVTLWAPHEGFPLNDSLATRYYVCK